MGGAGYLRAAARPQPRRPELQLLRRAGDGEQVARGSHRLGPHAEGRLPALQGPARLRSALPERLRLPGALDRGRGRARARAQLEEGDRGVRAGGVRAPLPRPRRQVVAGPDVGLEAAGHVDGLGHRLLHVQRHEHRVRLADAEVGARAQLALPRAPLDRVVPALRHVALAARAVAVRRLPGAPRPVALRPVPTSRQARRVARDLDDDALDAAGERGGGRQAGRGVRPTRERRMGRRRPLPGRGARGPAAGVGARRLALLRPVRHAAAGLGGRAPRHPVGRRHARPGHRHRPHRSRLRRRGLRPVQGPRPAGADARGRVGALLRRLRLAARPLDRRGDRPDRRQPRRTRSARRGDDVRALVSALLALRHAADLPHRRRLADQRDGSPAAAARRERDGGVDAGVHGQAHGRLAPQHGGLEHLAAPLLRAAVAVLPVRLRAPERDRIARRARGAGGRRARPARGAAPAVDRPRAHPLRGLRRGGGARQGGRRRLARRGHRPVLDARLAERGVEGAGLRDGRGRGADHRRPARSRLLGEVVPGRLGVGDARADPALVLLAAVHVGGADGPRAVPAGARLREDAGRARPRDARFVGEHDRRTGRVRAHGRRRDALAVLRAAAGPEPPVRLRAGGRDQAQAADAVELRLVLRHVREHRRVPAGLVLARAGCERPEAARPVARRADARLRRRRRRRVTSRG